MIHNWSRPPSPLPDPGLGDPRGGRRTVAGEVAPRRAKELQGFTQSYLLTPNVQGCFLRGLR